MLLLLWLCVCVVDIVVACDRVVVVVGGMRMVVGVACYCVLL